MENKFAFDHQIEGTKDRIDKFVLLSGSARRSELLDFLNPVISSTEVDERGIEAHFMEVYKGDDFVTRVAKTCCEISKAKSDIALEENTMYISADTMVVCDGQVYNKPKDRDEAAAMFMSYFGKNHYVVTSVCLRMKNYINVFYTLAELSFVDYYDCLEGPIREYLDTDTQMDKAGAYGIQDLDPRFVRSICGDIHTIIGMPVAETCSRIFAGHSV